MKIKQQIEEIKNDKILHLKMLCIFIFIGFLFVFGMYLTKETEVIKIKYVDISQGKSTNELCFLVISIGISIGLILHGFPFKFSSYTDSSTINDYIKER